MPADRIERRSLRQTTLTGQSTSVASSSSASSKKNKKKSVSGRVYSDAILTIKPEWAKLIAKREKNYEYRKYELRETVERIWLYETAPTSAITHVMTTTRPKRPGEVNDPSGFGNDDFDKGLKDSKFGYPVLGLYKLNPPIRSGDMKSKFDISPLQGYLYAPRKLVDDIPLHSMEKLF